MLLRGSLPVTGRLRLHRRNRRPGSGFREAFEVNDKGVTLRQAAKACDHFTRAGIMVHAYLMYGFPTQTAQETINALEIVRQFFHEGLIQSAFWHRFTATIHSDVGKNPKK
jgi:hypothetical protein